MQWRQKDSKEPKSICVWLGKGIIVHGSHQGQVVCQIVSTVISGTTYGQSPHGTSIHDLCISQLTAFVEVVSFFDERGIILANHTGNMVDLTMEPCRGLKLGHPGTDPARQVLINAHGERQIGPIIHQEASIMPEQDSRIIVRVKASQLFQLHLYVATVAS
jgi:hypothetical protein